MSSMIQIPSSALFVLQPSQLTYEENFVIRFPPSLATSVRSDLQETGVPGDLEINFSQQDGRLAKVKFDGRTYQGVLCDLPTIIETHKTTDRSQYIKVADVHQVLIVLDGSPDAVKQKLDFYRANDFKLDDGLSAPMKNVRNRRFSNKSSENAKRMEEMEAKLNLLLEADERAESVNYMLYDSKNRPIQFKQTGRKTNKIVTEMEVTETVEIEETQVVEEEVESDDSDFAAELEGDLLDELEQDEFEAQEDQEESVFEEECSNANESLEKLEDSHLPPAIQQLCKQIEEKKNQLNSVTNPAIKQRLEEVISYLEKQLSDKMRDL